ncbi:TPA: hypothetical protein ACWK8J_004992 [Escherichia coli]
MQRAENAPDAFFRFVPGKTSLFAVFASESRSARFGGAYNTDVMVNQAGMVIIFPAASPSFLSCSELNLFVYFVFCCIVSSL